MIRTILLCSKVAGGLHRESLGLVPAYLPGIVDCYRAKHASYSSTRTTPGSTYHGSDSPVLVCLSALPDVRKRSQEALGFALPQDNVEAV